MQRNVILSEEERGYFAALFDEEITVVPAGSDNLSHMISVTAEVPKLIGSLLGQAQFTLLAEVGHYKLWFPMEMTLDEFGQLNPVLGIPEVVEYAGNQRSWRLTELDELSVSNASYTGKVKVLSLSSTGMALQLDCAEVAAQMRLSSEITLQLPDGQLLQLSMVPVRQHGSMLATRITACKQNRDVLRRYLFQRHRQRHPALYQA
ncbi:hypothetical protein [Arsukibacterium ikkense]|uniref:hypothetical protein n=1 Tax=Arsukibacterium ikkense TaxID=336831 RepID=UPI00069B913C|nr:hypothetical protein [Arsukibacterium ikkense]